MSDIKFSKTGLCYRDDDDYSECILNNDALLELCLKCHADNSIRTLRYDELDDVKKNHLKTQVESLLLEDMKNRNDHRIPKTDFKNNRYVFNPKGLDMHIRLSYENTYMEIQLEANYYDKIIIESIIIDIAELKSLDRIKKLKTIL